MSTSVSMRSPGSLNPTRQQLDELDALLKRMLELPVNQIDNADEAEGEEEADEPAAPAVVPMEMKPLASPISYMVIETASPRPLPPSSGFEPRPSLLTPRLVPVTPPPESPVEEEEPAASAEDAPPTEDPLPAPSAVETETSAADSPSSEAEVWVPLRSTWQPSAQTWQPLAESWQQAQGAAPEFAAPENPPPDPTPLEVLPLPTLPDAADPIESVTPAAPTVAPAAPVAAPPAESRLQLSAEDAPVAVSPFLLPLLWFNQGFDACLSPLGAPGRWLCDRRGRHALGTVGLLSLAAAAAVAVCAGLGWTW